MLKQAIVAQCTSDVANSDMTHGRMVSPTLHASAHESIKFTLMAVVTVHQQTGWQTQEVEEALRRGQQHRLISPSAIRMNDA